MYKNVYKVTLSLLPSTMCKGKFHMCVLLLRPMQNFLWNT